MSSADSVIQRGFKEEGRRAAEDVPLSTANPRKPVRVDNLKPGLRQFGHRSESPDQECGTKHVRFGASIRRGSAPFGRMPNRAESKAAYIKVLPNGRTEFGRTMQLAARFPPV